jgi:hypothetical protein
MRNIIRAATPAAVLALAGQLFAGGFWLQLGNPEANDAARKNNAVLLVKAVGCHDTAGAQVTANAIGVVDGHRRSIALKVEPLSEPGTFIITRQWPAEGRWVIQLIGKNGEQFTNTLVPVGPDGADRLSAKLDMKAFAPDEIDRMLR